MDIFGNKKPVQIEDGEWWFNGNIIQKQDHPQLPDYIIFPDGGVRVHIARTFREAKKIAMENPNQNPENLPNNYL